MGNRARPAQGGVGASVKRNMDCNNTLSIHMIGVTMVSDCLQVFQGFVIPLQRKALTKTIFEVYLIGNRCAGRSTTTAHH